MLFRASKLVNMSLRTVCCNLGSRVTTRSLKDMYRIECDLKVNFRERRRREREKIRDFEWILGKMFPKFDPNVLLHFNSASSRNLFSKPLFSSFTSTSLWNLFFSKPSASLHIKTFSPKSAIFPASLPASLLHPTYANWAVLTSGAVIGFTKTRSLLLEHHRLWDCRIASL